MLLVLPVSTATPDRASISGKGEQEAAPILVINQELPLY